MPSPSFELKTEIVRAGAGAGKTTRLTHQVLDVVSAFVREHQRYPHLVVTTFTRKATQELRERLMLEAVKRGDMALLEYVSSKSHLSISTIHGVLSLFLSRFASHLDLDPSFRILGIKEMRRESRKILRALLMDQVESQNLLETYRFDDLNELCLQYFDWKSFYPDMQPYHLADMQEQALKWGLEMATKLGQISAQILRETESDKWQGFAYHLQEIAADLKLADWSLARTRALLRMESQRKPVRTQKNPGVSETTHSELEQIRDELKRLKEKRLDPETWQMIAAHQEAFHQLAEPFCERMRMQKYRHGQLQMADLELASLEVIRRFPDLAHSFAQEWDYWLIDEYQDTSPIQVELLRHMMGDRPHFVVGDPQQSIYLFRGARMEVFAQKETDVRDMQGLQNSLRKNYRSRPELLLFFNDLFATVNPAFQPMEPRTHEAHQPGTVVATFAIVPEDENAKGSERRSGELDAIVLHVQTLLQEGVRPEEICILGRANRHLTEVALALQNHNIATQVHAASGFYERREIRDALALLKFLVHPHDNANLIELFRSPWFRVDDHELVRLAVGNEQSLWTHLVRHAEGDTLRVVNQLKDWMTQAHLGGVSATFGKALVQHGYFDFSHHHDATGRREANLWKLISRLKTEERQPGFNYLEFISANISDLRNSDGAEESDATPALEPNRVNLMTVHSSKGLQFQHVLVPFAGKRPQTTQASSFVIDEDARKWSITVFSEEDETLTQPWLGHLQVQKMREREKQESDRVFYVALTRAKSSVYMSWTGRPETDSWAAKIGLDLSAGIHAGSRYSYKVDMGPWVPEPLPRQMGAEILIRDPFLPGLSVRPAMAEDRNPFLKLHYQSVTDLLDERDRSTHLSWHAQQARVDGLTTLHRAAGEVDLQRILLRIQRSSEGTLAHQLFELMKYQQDVQPTASRYFAGREHEISKALQYARNLRHPPLLDLLRDGFVEWGFVVQEGRLILEGQIDLWGRAPDGTVWIVDYKTGNPAGLDKAFDQLNLYSWALRRSGQVRPEEEIHLAVVYPFHEQMHMRLALTATEVQSQFLK